MLLEVLSGERQLNNTPHDFLAGFNPNPDDELTNERVRTSSLAVVGTFYRHSRARWLLKNPEYLGPQYMLVPEPANHVSKAAVAVFGYDRELRMFVHIGYVGDGAGWAMEGTWPTTKHGVKAVSFVRRDTTGTSMEAPTKFSFYY